MFSAFKFKTNNIFKAVELLRFQVCGQQYKIYCCSLVDNKLFNLKLHDREREKNLTILLGRDSFKMHTFVKTHMLTNFTGKFLLLIHF